MVFSSGGTLFCDQSFVTIILLYCSRYKTSCSFVKLHMSGKYFAKIHNESYYKLKNNFICNYIFEIFLCLRPLNRISERNHCYVYVECANIHLARLFLQQMISWKSAFGILRSVTRLLTASVTKGITHMYQILNIWLHRSEQFQGIHSIAFIENKTIWKMDITFMKDFRFVISMYTSLKLRKYLADSRFIQRAS